MAGERKTQVFGPTTWIKGDRGLMRPHTTDMPKLINMRVHRNGYLGPRPRWINPSYSVTTFGSNPRIIPTIFDTGDVAGELNVTAGVLFIENSLMEFYSYLTGSLYAQEDGTIVAPTNVSTLTSVDDADGGLLIVGGNVVRLSVEGTNIAPYLRNSSAEAAALTTFHSGLNTLNFIGGVLHQGRMYYWGGYEENQSVFDEAGSASLEPTDVTIHKNRLWYSDLHDYASFTNDTQRIDFDMDIQGVFSIGASLFIWGFEGDWYMLQGRQDPAAGTLNYLGKFRIPSRKHRPVLMNDRGYFWSIDLKTIVTIKESGEIDETSLQAFGISDEGISTLAGITGATMHADSVLNTMIFVGGNADDLHRHWQEGIWTEEDWSTLPAAVSGNAVQIGSLTVLGYEVLIGVDNSGDYHIYHRSTQTNHLGQQSGTEAESGMVGTVRIPLIVDPQDTLRIERVLVDIEGERQSGESDPTMTARVERQDGSTLDLVIGPESDQLTFVEGGGRAKRRLQFSPEDMDRFTPRAEVVLTDIARLAIEQVTVEYTIGTSELT